MMERVKQIFTHSRLPDFPSFQESLLSRLANDMAKGEEKLLFEALEKHLGRTPTIQDAKDCEMVTTPEMKNGSYFLCYKGQKLGYMEKSDMKSDYGNSLAENNLRVYMEVMFHPNTVNS